ncbi:hypothetical protein AOCH_001283, partial [Aspergillus ochraceoroseus]
MDVCTPLKIRCYLEPSIFRIEVFFQLENPANADVIQQSITITHDLARFYPSLSSEELAVDVASGILAARVLPYINGNVHVMSNPCYSFHTQKIVEAGRRYHAIFRRLDPNSDPSRVIMKVPATWEGLQACRILKAEGIKTLGTTVFSMEQCILAGE